MSDRTDSSFVRMREEVNYERRLLVMIVKYVQWIDSEKYYTSFIVPVLDLCCMDQPLQYC